MIPRALVPYLGILKDSFREALSSRVLWVLLLISTLFLLVIAPFGINDRRATALPRWAVTDWPQLTRRLAEGAVETGPPAARRLWQRLPQELRDRVTAQVAAGDAGFNRDLAEAIRRNLNQQLESSDFYAADAFPTDSLPEEAKPLVSTGVEQLDKASRERLHRLLIEATLPGTISADNSNATSVSYLIWTPFDNLPLTRPQLKTLIRGVVAAVMNLLIGTFGVLAAVLVTAPMITQTFEPGSIDLLLSKPVWRSGVFLTKVLGGGAFIAFNALYFVTGMWLIAGWRFDLWIGSLWWCIPLFVFMYLVFFSVCSFAGVVWRNAIVAMVLTVFFWGLGGGISLVSSVMGQVSLDARKINRLVPGTEGRIGITAQGQVQEWNAATSKWEEVFVGPNKLPGPLAALQGDWLGPVQDPTTKRLYASREAPRRERRGFNLFPPASNLLFSESEDASRQQEGPALPAGPRAMFLGEPGQLLVVATDGVFELQVPAGEKLSKKSGKFQFLGPDPRLKLNKDSAAGRDPVSGRIATFSNGEVSLLERQPDTGKFRLLVRRELPEAARAGRVTISPTPGGIVLALDEGRVLVLDPQSLETRHEFRPSRFDEPRFAETSSDGKRVVVLYAEGTCWLYDTQAKRELPAHYSWRQISAVSFDATPGADGSAPNSDGLWVVDRGTRRSLYRLDTGSRQQREAPGLEITDLLYYYVLPPLENSIRK
ncbi:MAG: ABC transporter permease, partial [Planctomycetaceae bacterium]